MDGHHPTDLMLDAQAQTTPPQPHQPEAIDLTRELPDQKRGDYSDISTLDTALATLLMHYPEAPVAATGADGLLVAMPASVPLQRNPVLQARTGMELVSAEDRGRLLTGWDKVLTSGASRCQVHLASDPDAEVTCSWFDVRETHGVIVVVLVPLDGASSPIPEVPESPPVTSRFVRISKDDAGIIVGIDRAVTQLLGWSAEEMEGHRSTEFFHPDDRALSIDNWLEMLASPGIGRRVRLRHRHRDGSWMWFEVTNNNLLEDPDYRSVVCEMVDISEEMAREQLLGRLAETVPVGLFQIDADRHIVYTNDRLHQILGVEGATSVEMQLATVVEADGPALERALNDVLGKGEDADLEVQLQLPASGTLRFCTISLRALTHGDGSISGAIACVADVTDSTRMREELKKRATFDELTGCYNRPSIMDALAASVAEGQRRGERAVMFIDLDRFKEVNDREGHAAGDALLRIVAERLRSVVRADDMVGRIGGDEFLLVCPEIGGAEQAMELAGRIAKALREQLGTATVRTASQLQASIGVAWSSGDGVGADTLVAQADNAMYESKRERKGQPSLATAVPETAA
jgi:diguanylate cyclase (GGDEF)-like protein/PAS domain S-box-containing protein